MRYQTFKRALIAVTILSLLFLTPEAFGQFKAGSIHLPGSGGTPPTGYRFFTKQSVTTAGWSIEASATSDRMDVYLDGTSIYLKSSGDGIRLDGGDISINGGNLSFTGTANRRVIYNHNSAGSLDVDTTGAAHSIRFHRLSDSGSDFVIFSPGTATVVLQVSASGVAIGGGAAIVKHDSDTASLDYAQASANTCEVLQVTSTGAADGYPVQIGIPHALATHNSTSTFFAWANTDVVNIRRCVISADGTDPASATVRVSWDQH